MTVDEFKDLGLSIEVDDILYVESGLEWMRDNTSLNIDMGDQESIKDLPASAKLFLVKFCELGKRDVTVTSESVGPMSQGFTSEGNDRLVYKLARQLLKVYLKPNVTFIPCIQRWH